MGVPVAAIGSFGTVFSGVERSATGKGVSGYLDGGGSTTIDMRFTDGTYPGATGNVINISGFYEVT